MSLRPIPWASYQCSSTHRMFPLGSLTWALPLSFLHRPDPWVFSRYAKSRILVPTAITSISSIWPMISNFTVYLFFLLTPFKCSTMAIDSPCSSCYWSFSQRELIMTTENSPSWMSENSPTLVKVLERGLGACAAFTFGKNNQHRFRVLPTIINGAHQSTVPTAPMQNGYAYLGYCRLASGIFQIRNDHIVFSSSDAVVRYCNHGNARYSLYFSTHSFGNHRGTAKCGARLNE